jgi:hypothetical protein
VISVVYWLFYPFFSCFRLNNRIPHFIFGNFVLVSMLAFIILGGSFDEHFFKLFLRSQFFVDIDLGERHGLHSST